MDRTARRLSFVRLLALTATSTLTIIGLATASGDTGGAGAAVFELDAAQQALQDPKRLVGTDWRRTLAPALDQLAELSGTRTVIGPLSGRITADTVYLPARVEVAEDTIIIARHIVFAGNRVTIVGKGHDVTLLPVESMKARGLAVGGGLTSSAVAAAEAAGVITIDQSGTEGQQGSPGFNGHDGFPGMTGRPGTDYGPDNSCVVDIAGDGGRGGDGTGGEAGTGGNGGGQGGNITVDIPAGSTDRYVLRATGGRGGAGGPGGQGGSGGSGGAGGEGGDVYCPYGPGGRGGNGGNGGTGGPGGKGGSGHNGGKGGTIMVSYPDGYDPGLISADASGGARGDGGPGGPAGPPGRGGPGGGPGTNNQNGWQGESGWPGSGGTFGGNGPAGDPGQPGEAGTVTLVGSGATTLATDRTVYEVGQSPVYTVTGKPNSPIFWSSWKDGVSTGEVDAHYGQITDANGNWTGAGGPWQPGDVSSNFVKQAKVDGKTAHVQLEILPAGSLTRWAGWNSLQGLTVIERMGVAETGPLSRYLFARGADDALHYNYHDCWSAGNCGWSGWESLGGAITSRPVAAARGVWPYAVVDVFVRGTDGAVYYRHQNFS